MIRHRRKMGRAWPAYACLLAGGLLAACGGGGGGSTPPPADTTPPAVAAVSPADKASGVAMNVQVTVTFSEAMDCAKAGGDSLTVSHAGAAVAGAVTCSGSTLSFKPTSLLPTNATLTATASGAMADLAGNRLGSAHAWRFDVRPWTVQVAASSFEVVAIDAAGNFHVAGSTAASMDASFPTGGALLAKYDALGNQLWARQFGSRQDSATALTIGADGSVFVGGLADNDPVRNPGLFKSVFIAKYDASGTQLWLKRFGSQVNDLLRALQADADGNVVAVGYTQGDLFSRNAGGSSDFFVMKLDAAGNLRWGRQDGGALGDNAGGLAVSAAGEIFVAGYAGTALHGQASSGGTDAFLIKYAADGTRQWTQFIGSAGSDYGATVRRDAGGNLYVLGRTSGTFTGQSSAGGLDAFVAKIDAAGALQWVRQLGTAGDEYPTAMTLNGAGGLRIAGFTTGAFPGASNTGAQNGFMAQLDPGATLQWARQWGGTGSEYVYGIALDAADNTFVASTRSAPGSTGAGNLEAFLLKFAPDGTPR